MTDTLPAIRELMNRDYACACGQTHRIRTRQVAIEPDAARQLPGHIRRLGLPEKILVIADENTQAAAGAEVVRHLSDAGMTVRQCVLPAAHLHTDEHAVGAVMLAAEPLPELIVSVGSGTLNDLGRFCAARMKIPYLVMATAASVDGYASDVTPVLREGMKITYPGIPPQMVAADPRVIAAAPRALMAAGLGDLIGKQTARLDWLLASAMTGEHFCPVLTAMMDKALGDCVALAPRMTGADSQAAAVMEALVLAGLAMQMQGNSRPASGSEHHIAHFLEMRDAMNGRPPALHGDKVGAASLLVMALYEKLFSGAPPAQGPVFSEEQWHERLRRAFGPVAEPLLAQLPPDPEDSVWQAQWDRLTARWDDFRREAQKLPELRRRYAQALRTAGGPTTLSELGYSREDVRDALLCARAVRPRFTILTALSLRGLLPHMTEELLDAFYQ